MEKDLRDMEWPKVEKVFAQLFLRVGIVTVRDCAEEHNSAEKRSKSTAERRRSDEAYQNILVRLVEKHLGQLGYSSPLGTADITHNRREFYAAVEFLLDLDSTSDMAGSPSTPERGKREHLVGRSTVGNPRLVGPGDGHRPMIRGLGERSEKKGGKKSAEEWIYDPDADPARQVRYMQSEMARLKKENRNLRLQKQDIESIYQQLVSEQRFEKFDQRRLNLLKSQNLQLERQLAMSSSALHCRKGVARQLRELLDELSEHVNMYSGSGNSSGENGQIEGTETSGGDNGTAALADLVGRHQSTLAKSSALAKTSCLQQQLYYSHGRAPTSAPRSGEGVAGLRRRPGNFARMQAGRSLSKDGACSIFVQDVITVAVADADAEESAAPGDPPPLRHLDLSAIAGSILRSAYTVSS